MRKLSSDGTVDIISITKSYLKCRVDDLLDSQLNDRQTTSLGFPMLWLGLFDRSRSDRLCVTEELQWALAAVTTGQACAQSKWQFPARGSVKKSTQIWRSNQCIDGRSNQSLQQSYQKFRCTALAAVRSRGWRGPG